MDFSFLSEGLWQGHPFQYIGLPVQGLVPGMLPYGKDHGFKGKMKARDALHRMDARAVNKVLSRKLDTNESAVIVLSYNTN